MVLAKKNFSILYLQHSITYENLKDMITGKAHQYLLENISKENYQY
jgi:hypothetical protein